MLSFYKFYDKLNLVETKVEEDTLWKYYEYVKNNPNLDDLKTLLAMLEKKYTGVDATGTFADFFGGIIHAIIPKLPTSDQEEAKKIIANLKVHPRTELKLRVQGHKGFDNLQEFEDFISKSIEKEWASSAIKVAMRPENKYWWEMTSPDMKEALRDAIVDQHERNINQPSIADMLKKHLREKPETGWEST